MSEKETVVDLLADKNQLTEENYTLKRNHAGVLLTIIAVSWLGIAFLLWLAFIHFPQKQVAWTSNAGAVCNLTPIKEPHIHHQVAIDFAVEAAVMTQTYDYVNWRRQLTDTSNRYYTPDFRNSFMLAFPESRTLATVLNNLFIVSSTSIPNKPAQLAAVGRKGATGAYYWDIQVPLTVSYVSGRKINPEVVRADVRVIRVEPSRLNPRGIAVDNIQTRQLLN